MKKITLLLALFLVLFSWNINAQITTYPYFEDFESGDGGWTVDDPTLGSWELGTPANTIINSADTGVNAWVTNLTGEYATGESASVVSPVFDLSSLSAPSIEFSVWWNAEFSWDGMVLQSSIDAGTSWQNVGDVGDPNNWYNDDSIAGNPGGQTVGWTGRDQTTNGSAGWVIARHALIGLAGESNVLLRVAFGSDGSVQDEGVGFDSINIFEVSCPEPSGITVAGITGATADITWVAGGAETAWEVVVQAAGTGAPTGSGTSTASNNPYSVSGLTAITDYEVYVRSDCSGEFSSWVGPIAFQTACTTFIPDYNADMSVNVPDCWDEADDGEVAAGPSGSGTSDWDDGNTYALGASNAINLFQGDTDREWLLSPMFDLSADGYQLEINVAVTNWNDGFADDTMGSDDEVQLLQSIDGGATWTTLTTWNAANEPALGGTEYIEDLTGVTGTSVQFAIWASDGTIDDAEDYDFHVGKFRVRTPPTCPEPINLTLDTFSDVTADISWTPGGSEASWEVIIQPAGTGVPTGPGVATAVATYTATGLTATTDYEIWIRGVCGAGDLSSWVGPITFTTFSTPPPPPVGVTCASGSSSFIYTAEFDGLDGWTGDFNGGDGTWEIPNDSGSGGTGADAAFSGANFMNYEASGGAITASAVSPAIDMTTAVDGAELSFYMHAFGGDMGTLNVGISNSAAGPFTTEFTWTGDLQTDGAQPWVAVGINLDAYLGQVIYVEFSHTGTGNFEGDMSIDLMKVETCGSFCIAPSSILTSNATQTTVDIDWTANSGETAWEYVVVPAGTGVPIGSGNSVTSTSITETGLVGLTQYEVWIRADCGGGFFSLWSGPIPFFTAPANNNPCDASVAVVNDGILCETRTFGSIIQATASGEADPSCGGTADDDVWFQFVAESEFQLIALANIAGSNTFDIDHSVYEGTCDNLTEISCVSGFAELSSVTPQLTIGQTYFIRIYSGDTNSETTTFDLCITPYVAPVNVDCDTAIDYCSGSDDSDILYSYNTINVLPGFGTVDCLFTSPNPTFNLLRIATSGDILIEMVQNTAFDENDIPIGDELDVDFILWGPYAANDILCDAMTGLGLAAIVDCSYSAAPVENVTLLGALEDEIYLLLITNFEEEAGVIQVRQTNTSDPGAGTTVADIEVEIGYTAGGFDDTDGDMLGDLINVCDDLSINPSVTLTAVSPSADAYEWYQNGFVIPGETSSTLVVTESDSYQVRVFNNGCEAEAFSQLVFVNLYNEATANQPDPIITCDDPSADGFENFDLSIRIAQILGTQDPSNFTVTFYANITDANLRTNPLPLNFTNTTVNAQTIFVRVENNAAIADGYLQCRDITTLDLIISGPTPTVTSGVIYPECDDDMDGVTLFDLTTQDGNLLDTQSAADFIVTYHETQNDADAGTGAIDTSSLYSSITTTIFVRIQSNLAFDCFDTGMLELVVDPLPNTTFSTTFDYEVCPNATTPIIITATANNYTESEVTISWYFDNGLIAGETGLTLPVIDAGLYEIEVMFNQSQCFSSISQIVIELPTCVIPQGISPNDDGLNDTFDLSSYDVTKLEIFNRNGTSVYSKTEYTNEWHGQTDGGDELPVGTYFYTMEYQGGKQRTAWIYIQREN